jgi:hypothetical protein
MSALGRRLQQAGSVPGAQSPLYGPISISSAAEAVTQLHAPAGASYVVWNDSWPNDLQTVFWTYLGADDILVLPERDEPYYVDTSNGFMYGSSVVSWSDGALVVHATNTFGEMARARRGILGLGPRAVVALKPSSFTQGAQGNSTTRYYTDTSGTKHYENGCWEKIIGCGHAAAYFGNFTMAPSLDFGGVAYHGIAYGGQDGNSIIFERIYAQGAHRGFASAPNGETGALSMNHGIYQIYHCEVDCRLPDGTPVGTSPIMWNNMLGGTIDTCYLHHAVKGMPTFWNCGGTQTINNVRSENMLASTCWNLEDSRAGVVYNFTGGDLLAPGSKFQLGIGAYNASAQINCRGVGFDSSQSYWPGYFAISVYTSGMSDNQIDSDVSILDADGNPVPVKFSM